MRIVSSISHSFLETAQRCAKKLEYRYVRGYQVKVGDTKPERGTWIHELLAAYYLALKSKHPDPIKVARFRHAKYKADFWDQLWDEEKEQLGEDMPDTAWGIFERYVKHYANVDQAWRKIIFVEKAIKVPIPGLPVPFNFKCDLVVLDEMGFVWIIDHKVVGSIPNEDSRAIDPQGARYVLAMQHVLESKNIRVKGIGMIYDYIRDRLPTVPQLLKSGDRLSVAKIDTDVETYMAAIKAHGFDPADYKDKLDDIARNGTPFFERWAVPKSDERLYQERLNMQALANEYVPKKFFYPRHLNRYQCPWDCEFRDLCLAELEGADISHILKDRFIVKGGAEDDCRAV